MSIGTSTEKDHDHSSALKLWKAVITQAVVDSYSDKRHDRLPVSRWLVNDDFETVCGLAQVEPYPIKKCLAEILKENGSIRAFVLGRKMIAELEQS